MYDSVQLYQLIAESYAMCYHVYQHTLVHDSRPIIQYGEVPEDKIIVNPYAEPRPCPCEGQDNSIAAWFRCSFGHKCCYLVSRIVRCTKVVLQKGVPCSALISYHVYNPARSVYRCNNAGPDHTSYDGSEREGWWYPWPVLDSEIGLQENRNELFLPHDEPVLLDLGRAILECESNGSEPSLPLRSPLTDEKDCLQKLKELTEELMKMKTRRAIMR